MLVGRFVQLLGCKMHCSGEEKKLSWGSGWLAGLFSELPERM